MNAEPPYTGDSWLSSDRSVPRLIARPVLTFLHTEAAGGMVLLAATLVALVWANSPFAESYRTLWHTEASVSMGSFELAHDLRHWVNEGLMTIFFFVVALEIKRELVVGELNDPRKAALPVVAAFGGMVVPAAIYALLNWAGPGASGWGIPMATDIAFALGVLALLGDRIPSGLKVFLLSLAIVDDVGAILVIALFYSAGIDLQWVALAAFVVGIVALLKKMDVKSIPVFVFLGFVMWVGMLESGVHATIAGVVLGLMTPAIPTGDNGTSVAEWLVSRLHPWTSFIVIPLFALANAGLSVSLELFGAAARSPVTLGIVGGLVLGKVIGIAGASWLAMRLKLVARPEGMSAHELLGASALAGIGFTVSLFIASLAFTSDELQDAAKVGIFLASAIAGAAGILILRADRGDEEDIAESS
ncbi:MAG TPA: Na+/H+ antiporter NhaA [Actinomycetota bacterium]|nr:Na+/H+ antiporter NhaA [Actinomycetota bacterium]